MLIGIDLGTSTCKIIAVDPEGKVVAVASRDYPMINLRPGWAEQEPDAWWRATGEAMTDLTSQLPQGGAEVVGIGMCGQMHGLTPLDADGNVIRPAILWNDQRAAAECDWITEQAGGLDELLRMTRNRMLPGFTGGKIIWLRDHEPEHYAPMVRLLNPKDYIRFRMTGVYATDVSDASGTGLFDVEHRTWSTELLGKIDVDPSLLPDVVESIEQTGTLADDLCEAWGLPAGTPVFGGGGDAVIQTTAMGLIEEGSAGFTIGTAGIVAGGLSRCPDNPDGRVQVSAGNEPGRWHIMGVSLSAGGAFQWLRDALTPLNDSQKLTFERLDLAGQGRRARRRRRDVRPVPAGRALALRRPGRQREPRRPLADARRRAHLPRRARGRADEPARDPRGLRRGRAADRPDHRLRRRDQGAPVAAAAGRRARPRGRHRHRRLRGRRVRRGPGRRRRRRRVAGPARRARRRPGGAHVHARSGSLERYDVVFAAHRRLHEALEDVYALVAAADGGGTADERAAVGEGTADA